MRFGVLLRKFEWHRASGADLYLGLEFGVFCQRIGWSAQVLEGEGAVGRHDFGLYIANITRATWLGPSATRSVIARVWLRVLTFRSSTGIPMLASIASDLVERLGPRGSVFFLLSLFSRFFRSGVGLARAKPL